MLYTTTEITWQHRSVALPKEDRRVLVYSPELNKDDPRRLCMMEGGYVVMSGNVEWWVYVDEPVELVDHVENNRREMEKRYFINRQGRVLKYKGSPLDTVISFHFVIASKIWPGSNHPEDQAMKAGYIKVGGTGYVHPVIDREPNQRQIDTLDELDLLRKLHINEKGRYVPYNSFRYC